MYAVQLNPGHGWKAAPGCRILVIDGGAVRLDFPVNWTVISTPKYVVLVDRAPPHNRALLAVAWRQFPPSAAGIPLAPLLSEAAGAECREVLHRGESVSVIRPPLEAAWIELRVADPVHKREMLTRICLARADCTQALLIFDLWPEDELSLHSVWTTFLATLTVGDYMDDPTTGQRRAQRG
jgi:hypothetical protein